MQNEVYEMSAEQVIARLYELNGGDADRVRAAEVATLLDRLAALLKLHDRRVTLVGPEPPVLVQSFESETPKPRPWCAGQT
jgi:hypothetical protein